jgi:hypothetical protein
MQSSQQQSAYTSSSQTVLLCYTDYKLRYVSIFQQYFVHKVQYFTACIAISSTSEAPHRRCKVTTATTTATATVIEITLC